MYWIYIYLALTISALIIEFISNEMVSIWFAGGGIVAMILSAFDVSWIIHVPVFVLVSAVLLASFRKVVMKYFNKNDSKTNADEAIGKEYELLTEIGFNQPGTIKVNGVVWGAITQNQKDAIPSGVIVKVIGIKGNKYIVEEN